MKKSITIIIVLLFSTCLLNAQNTVKIIVNPANSITSISKVKLSNIFLKKVTKFDNGVTAVPVDLVGDSPVREDFSNMYLGKSVAAVKNYWNQQLFSGAGVPPDEKSTNADVINFVKANAGAIGYISSGADVSGVKVIGVQ